MDHLIPSVRQTVDGNTKYDKFQGMVNVEGVTQVKTFLFFEDGGRVIALQLLLLLRQQCAVNVCWYPVPGQPNEKGS